jgi:hypothetical protein
MNFNLSNEFAILVLALTNPIVLIYLGLATVHTIAMHYYLKHEGGRPLAFCGGLTSTFYLLLAVLHGMAH